MSYLLNLFSSIFPRRNGLLKVNLINVESLKVLKLKIYIYITKIVIVNEDAGFLWKIRKFIMTGQQPYLHERKPQKLGDGDKLFKNLRFFSERFQTNYFKDFSSKT